MVEVYLRLLEQGYHEVKFAFEGLADDNVWKRPAEGLLCVGELAGHIAYWEAVRLAGEGGEPKEGLQIGTVCEQVQRLKSALHKKQVRIRNGAGGQIPLHAAAWRDVKRMCGYVSRFRSWL